MRQSPLGLRRPPDFSPMPGEVLETTVVPLFERMAEQYADRPAVTSSAQDLTYRQLNNAANHLAHQLAVASGDDQSPIAFLFDHEVRSIVALLAVLKLGRAYVPMHPGLPREELEFILEDSTASFLITAPAFRDAASGRSSGGGQIRTVLLEELQTDSKLPNPVREIAPNAPFAISYTSGSSGKPKGVLHGHLNKSQNALYRSHTWYFAPSDRVSLITPVTHAAAYPSLLGALLSGGVLCLFDPKSSTGRLGLEWMIKEEITVFQGPPSAFEAIVGLAPEGLTFPALRMIALGSEPVTSTAVELLESHTSEDCVMLNYYATTEAGPIAEFPVHHHGPRFEGYLPVGYAAPGRQLLLLDPEGRERRDDHEGEIAVRSRFLNLGYWRQPDLTAKRFQVDAMDPAVRTFHTGDLGRRRRDGALELVGRKDTQVKIRGFRVQLEAIDIALRGLEGVRDAVTILDRPSGRQPRLVAYVSMMPGHAFSTSRLRQQLSLRFPDYSIPSLFVQLNELPRTGVGKISRANLPAAGDTRPSLESEYVPPRNEQEATAARIWERVLGLNGVGVQDSFFELGGDSLSILEMTLEVEEALALSLPQTFFRKPTIEGMLAPSQPSAPSRSASTYPVLQTSPTPEATAWTPQGWRGAYAAYWRALAGQQISLARKLKKMARYVVENRYVDILVARYLGSMPFQQARDWATRWGEYPAVQKLIFPLRRRLYNRFVEHTGNRAAPSSESFGRNIAASMLFSIGHWWENPLSIEACRKSGRLYYRTLAQMLDEIPMGSVDGEFPVTGAEHLLRAHAAGRGVILLSIHGAPLVCGPYRLERLLGCEPIPTISDFAPWGRGIHAEEEPISATEDPALLAEIAYFAQMRLGAGGVVNLLPDVSEGRGTTGCYSVLGKQYWFKSGFAELAINTGAAVVPYYPTLAADGRIQTKIAAQFQQTDGARETRVRGLLAQYARFMEHAFRSDPEAWFWVKMEIQLNLPPVDEPPGE